MRKVKILALSALLVVIASACQSNPERAAERAKERLDREQERIDRMDRIMSD